MSLDFDDLTFIKSLLEDRYPFKFEIEQPHIKKLVRHWSAVPINDRPDTLTSWICKSADKGQIAVTQTNDEFKVMFKNESEMVAWKLKYL